jgi:hypothetical protein
MRRVLLLAACTAIACGKKSVPSWDLSAPVPTGQARAGQTLKSSDLVGGPKSRAQVGDFKIYNANVRFIISGTEPASGYEAYGGNIVAADLTRLKGPDQSDWGELIHGIGFRAINPDKVEVIHTGIGGGPAQVRVTAHDDVLPIIEAFLGTGTKPAFPPLDLSITVDYVLEPDASALQVTTTYWTNGGEAKDIGSCQLAFIMGDGAPAYVDGQGFTDSAWGPQPFYGAIGTSVSYSVLPIGVTMTLSSALLGIGYGDLGDVSLAAGVRGKQVFYVAVGDGDVSSLLKIHDLIRPIGRAPILGQAVDSHGSPLSAVRIHMTLPSGDYVDFARTHLDGSFDGLVPAGPIQVQAIADGRPATTLTPLTVPASGLSDVTFTLADPSAIQVQVTEQGQPIPAKVMFFDQSGTAPNYPPNYGEETEPGGTAEMIFARPTTETVPILPGTYNVVAMRGFEYDMDQKTVVVAPGQTASAQLALNRVVDTAGYLSSDFHIHGAPSPDSDDLLTLKALSFGAEGLEVPIPTDHDVIFDYQPTIDSLGLTPFVRSIIGEEVSTTVYGHFNTFPCEILDQPNGGAVNWYFKDSPALFAAMRTNPAGPLIQVNHPRTALMGYFYALGFDPGTFAVTNPNHTQSELVTSFDAIEVMNGKEASATSLVFPDWFSFLNRGFHITGDGNSDSHKARSAEVGTPRNYVQVGVDDVTQLDPAQFVAAVRAAKLTVSAGPFVTMSINGKGLGDMATLDAQGSVNVSVKVQAPTWMGPIETLELVRNGDVIQTVTMSASTADPTNPVVRYNGTLVDNPTEDAWYIVEVISAGGNLGPIDGTHPFAFTNPIWVDVNGNGVFDPPIH